jgi:hypothetical protein
MAKKAVPMVRHLIIRHLFELRHSDSVLLINTPLQRGGNPERTELL